MSVDLATLNIEVNSSRVKEASKSLDDLTAAASKTDKKVDGLGDTSAKTGNEVGGLGAKARKTGSDIDGMGVSASRAEQRAASMGGALGKVGGFIAGLGLLGVSKSIVQMASDFEQLQIRLNQTMGGAAAGQQAFDWIKQFAKDTPYEVKNVTDAFMRMRAYGIDPMNGSMKSVADAAAKLGGGYETLDGLSRGLGQAWAKQKLQGEEIMQLVERGVPVWDMLAKVTGKTTQEVMFQSVRKSQSVIIYWLGDQVC